MGPRKKLLLLYFTYNGILPRISFEQKNLGAKNIEEQNGPEDLCGSCKLVKNTEDDSGLGQVLSDSAAKAICQGLKNSMLPSLDVCF